MKRLKMPLLLGLFTFIMVCMTCGLFGPQMEGILECGTICTVEDCICRGSEPFIPLAIFLWHNATWVAFSCAGIVIALALALGLFHRPQNS